MAAGIAELSDLIPHDRDSPAGRFPRLGRLFRRRRALGLEAVPERYRLQFLILASERMPGRAPAEVAQAAGRLAEAVRAPRGLDTGETDAWFRANAGRIIALADKTVAG